MIEYIFIYSYIMNKLCESNYVLVEDNVDITESI